MVAGVGPKLAKLLLFIFNITIWAAGVALIIVGSIVVADQDSYTDTFGSSNIVVVSGITIGIGCFAFIVGFCGCRGTCKEGVGLLKLYWILVLIIILAEITVGILAFVFDDELEQSMLDGMQNTINNEYEISDAATLSVDSFQEGSNCCGAANYTDYLTCGGCDANLAVPESCCKDTAIVSQCQAGMKGVPTNPNSIWPDGCVKKASEAVADNYLLIGIISLCLIVFEILTMIFTCCVIDAIEKGEDMS